MKPSEYYEKYWKIRKPDGTMVSPPPLTDAQREYFDKACLYNMREVVFMSPRRRSRYINIELLMEEMKHLPDIIKPKEQPLLIAPIEMSEQTKKWIETMEERNRLLEQQKIGMFIPHNQPKDKYGNQ